VSLPSFWRPCRAWWLGQLLPQIGFSRYTFSDIRYVPLSSRLNLANRAVFEVMQGKVPIDVLGDLGGLRRKIKGLGGDETLRGYDTNRFIDQVRYSPTPSCATPCAASGCGASTWSGPEWPLRTWVGSGPT